MLRAGAILLTLWTGFKLLVALGILFMLLVLGKNSPALLLLYGDSQGKSLDPRALATINSLAVVANTAIAALSILSIVSHLERIDEASRMGVFGLGVALLFLDVVRWVGASVYYHQDNLLGGSVTLLPTFAGIAYAEIGLFRRT